MSENVSADWHLVAKTSEVTEDEPKAVRVGDHLIALFSLGGDYFATPFADERREIECIQGLRTTHGRNSAP